MRTNLGGTGSDMSKSLSSCRGFQEGEGLPAEVLLVGRPGAAVVWIGDHGSAWPPFRFGKTRMHSWES